MRIEKMEIGKEFRIKCIEHNASIRCEAHELRLVDKRTVSYECPVCAARHVVPSYRVEEITLFKHDIDPTDKHLPVNALKAADMAMQRSIKQFKKMRKFMKEEMRRRRTLDRLKKCAEEEHSTLDTGETVPSESPAEVPENNVESDI